MKGTMTVSLQVEYVCPADMEQERAEEIAKALVITGAHPYSKIEGVSVIIVDFQNEE